MSQRLSSELASEGHKVQFEMLQADPGCESYADGPASETIGVEPVLIQLGRVTGSRDAACATILYRTSEGTRQAHVTASLDDAPRFAIRVAEALNGLSRRAAASEPSVERNDDVELPQPSLDASTRSPVSVAASGLVLFDARHQVPLLGAGVVTELPLSTSWELQFDAAWTLTSLQLDGLNSELYARLAWVRMGAALRVLPHPTELDVMAGVGAALTWVTARVEPPVIARADIGTSALLSGGALFAYPSDSLLHGYVSLRASTLIPSVRFDLTSRQSSPFGALLGEGAIGVRSSW